MTSPATAEITRATRVLVFTVDDGYLCVDLDRVHTVYARNEVRVHTLRLAGTTARSFLIHREEPALIVDLREAFGLSEILGVTDRAVLLVMRAGSFPLAVPADACVGVRDLDLRTRTPVPTALQRDGGFSVGHLVELDGRMHTLLEPSRILSSALRERLDSCLQEARAFCERESRTAALIVKLRDESNLPDLKTYARLTRRNGRTRAAAAARAVLKAAQNAVQQGPPEAVSGEFTADTLLHHLLTLSAACQTGELQLTLQGGEPAVLFFGGGRIVDAHVAGTWGRPAVRQILAAGSGTYRFIASELSADPRRIADAAPWLLVETLEQLSEARRGHHPR
jgi:chemotaxis signal transduction protein